MEVAAFLSASAIGAWLYAGPQEGSNIAAEVEALIAAEGGFNKAPAGDVSRLEYWQLSGSRSHPGSIKHVSKGGFDPVKMRHDLELLVAAYDNPLTCYLSEPVPNRVLPFRPYKHLARCREWQIEADDD